jgi:hypothetical protein
VERSRSSPTERRRDRRPARAHPDRIRDHFHNRGHVFIGIATPGRWVGSRPRGARIAPAGDGRTGCARGRGPGSSPGRTAVDEVGVLGEHRPGGPYPSGSDGTDRPSRGRGEARGSEDGSGAARGARIGRMLDESGRRHHVRVPHRRAPGPQSGADPRRPGRHGGDGRVVGAPCAAAAARRLGQGRRGGVIPSIRYHVEQVGGQQRSVCPGGDEVRAAGLNDRGCEQAPRQERKHRAGLEWAPSFRKESPCHNMHGRAGHDPFLRGGEAFRGLDPGSDRLPPVSADESSI